MNAQLDLQAQLEASKRDPRLLAAAQALTENRLPEAEERLRTYLQLHPTNVAAIRMLAELGSRIGQYPDAEYLLERCLELAPGFIAARHNYAFVLHRSGKSVDALAQINLLLSGEPHNISYRNLKAAILASLGEIQASVQLYAGVVAEQPRQPKIWMSYGHALKTAGREVECLAAYRRSIALAPNLGEAWWSLANLKTSRFTVQEREAMQQCLQRSDLTVEDRFHFHFALGKALEDEGQFEAAFQHYAQGNALRREGIAYNAADVETHVTRSRALFTREFFAERRGMGSPAPDPIFVVGLPRSGSTLVEQILASHSQVEGTQELPELPGLVRKLGNRNSAIGADGKYLAALEALNATEVRALGEQYLVQTRIRRKTAAPFFIDKLPNNWAHVGFIHLVLPNARIIDARRHPLACCFSGFKQHFARGQHFTYSLQEIGRYYRDYVELMAHFDAVLPGRVHRVRYESLVDNTEVEVRRLLAYCGLPYEEQCLHFHRNERAVRTASSQQVRQPIYRDAVEQWRNFDAWLDPLKAALGPALGVSR